MSESLRESSVGAGTTVEPRVPWFQADTAGLEMATDASLHLLAPRLPPIAVDDIGRVVRFSPGTAEAIES